LTEKLIKDRPMLPRNQQEFKEHLLSLGENNTILPPIFFAETNLLNYQGMPVYTWNEKDGDNRIIFYVHGGEYVFNPMPVHYDTLREITKKTDSQAIMPIYHKLPKYTYKDNYPVLLSLYKELLEKHPNAEIIFMGDSAGGGLALGLAQLIRDENIKGPARIILISPWVDANTNNPQIENYQPDDPLLVDWKLQITAEMWAGDKDNISNPLISPINGNFNDLGRISMFIGTREIFYPDVEKLHEKLNELKIDHDYIVGNDQNHVYVLYPIKEGREARETIIELINSKQNG